MIISNFTTIFCYVINDFAAARFLSTEELASYGLASPVLFLLLAIGDLMATGNQALVAKKLASGDFEEARHTYSNIVTWIMVLSLAGMSLLFLLRHQVAFLLGASGENLFLQNHTVSSLSGLIPGIPAMILAIVLSPVMYLERQNWRIYTSVAALVLVQCAGIWFSVAVCGGGLLGLSLALSAGFYASVAVLLLPIKKRSVIFSGFSLSLRPFVSAVRIGLPMALVDIYFSVTTVVLNHLLLHVSGYIAVASYSVVSGLNEFLGIIIYGMGMATVTHTALAIGKGDKGQIVSLMRTVFTFGLIVSVIEALVAFTAAYPLVRFFMEEESIAVHMEAVNCLRCYCFALPLLMLVEIYVSYFEASDKIAMAHILVLLDELVTISVAAVVLGLVFGVAGVWISFAVTEVIDLAFLYLCSWRSCGHRPRNLKDILFLV